MGTKLTKYCTYFYRLCKVIPIHKMGPNLATWRGAVGAPTDYLLLLESKDIEFIYVLFNDFLEFVRGVKTTLP